MPLRVQPISGARNWPTLLPAGQYAGKPPIVLGKAVALLGSGRTNHIRIHSRKISKAHSLILVSHGHAYIRDLASRTGIRVNGEETRERFLENGDTIQVGDVDFILKGNSNSKAGGSPSPVAGSFIDLQPATGQSPLHFRCKSVLVGRRSTCDLHIDNDSVSTAHAVLFEHEGVWSVRDLGSRHGTYVNGDRVDRQSAVRAGDVLRLGDAQIVISAASSSAAVAAAQPRGLALHSIAAKQDSQSSEIDVEWIGGDSDSDLVSPSAENLLSGSQSVAEASSPAVSDEQGRVGAPQREEPEDAEPSDSPDPQEADSLDLAARTPVPQIATPREPPSAKLASPPAPPVSSPAARPEEQTVRRGAGDSNAPATTTLHPSPDALTAPSDGGTPESDGASVTIVKMSLADLQKCLLEPPQDGRARGRRRRIIGATIVVTFMLLAAVAFVGWFKFGRS